MVEEKIIEWNKCKKCGFLQYPSHLSCIKCKNKSFEKIQAKGIPTLMTYTILNAPPMEFTDKKSLVLGVVQFENGIKLLGQISTKNDLMIGMKLKPVYQKICNNLDGKEVFDYSFEPVV